VATKAVSVSLDNFKHSQSSGHTSSISITGQFSTQPTLLATQAVSVSLNTDKAVATRAVSVTLDNFKQN